jgi:hypothetical protein
MHRDLDALTKFGARLELPAGLRRVADPGAVAAFVDPEAGVSWWVHVEEGLHLCLDEATLDDLREHVDHHARFLIRMSAEARGERDARSDDPTWSPLIDFERRGHALETVHRMAYRPGLEVIMGHRLLPTPRGLVEVRVMAQDTITGLRESLFTLRALAGGLPLPLAQKDMDVRLGGEGSPRDALSRVRKALDGVTLEGLEAMAPLERREVELPTTGFAVVPPPRFVYVSKVQGAELFARTSFCTTDGREYFALGRGRGRLERGALARAGCELGTRLARRNQVQDVRAEVLAEEASTAFVRIAGRGHLGALAQVYGVFAHDDGAWGHVVIGGADAVPSERRIDDLRASLMTLRRLPQKPFWKFW